MNYRHAAIIACARVERRVVPLEKTMRETIERLEKLRKHREYLNLAQQTVEREFEAARLDMEIAIIECEVRSAIAKLVLIFLDAWRRTGHFTAIREDGVRRESNPVVTGVPVQDFWNVRGEAHTLANWSLGINSPWGYVA